MFIAITVVFMGSQKYPDENAFDAFIKKHGGSDNASTDCERVIQTCHDYFSHTTVLVHELKHACRRCRLN